MLGLSFWPYQPSIVVMMDQRSLAPCGRQSLGSDLEAPAPLVDLDPIDQLPLRTLPPEIHEAAAPTLTRATTAICEEGADGPACRRLLARDITLARIQVRVLEGRRNIELENYLRGSGSERRVRLLDHLVSTQHRRLLASMDLLGRLSCTSPTIRISAHRAAVVIGEHG